MNTFYFRNEERYVGRYRFCYDVFNFFIVIPQICVNLFFGPVMKHLLGGSAIAAVGVGGISLLLAAFFTFFVQDNAAPKKA